MDGQTLLWLNAAGCVAGGVVGLLFAAVAWRNRDVPAALPYGALSLAVSGWGFLYAALLFTSEPTTATWLSQSVRVVTALVPALWLSFTIAYTEDRQPGLQSLMTVVWAVAIGYALFRLTAPFHGLIAYEVEFQTVQGLTAPVGPHGVAYWGAVAYAYLTIGIGFTLLVRFLLRSRNIYRKQTAAIVVGSLLPMFGNVAVIAGVVPHPALDVTPILFGVNGFVVGWALFRYDFLEVTPVATDVLVDDLPDPVLVTDDVGTVVESNDAADAAFPDYSVVGTPLADLPLPGGDVLADSQQVSLSVGEQERVYTPQISRLQDQHGVQRGRLIVLRDVTVQQRRFDRIEALQATTQQFLGATSAEEIARIAVEFFEHELAMSPAVWYRATDDELVPEISGRSVSASRIDSSQELFERFQRGETVVLDRDVLALDDAGSDFDRVLVVPIGDDGTFCLGLSAEDNVAEHRQLAHVLRGTMAAALARVEREVQLRESRREIDRRTEQIEFFSGVLRHNIRNGMQVIRSQTEQLADHTGEGGDAQIETVRQWADDLIGLTQKVKEITDVVTAGGEEQRRPVELDPILDECLDSVATAHDVTINRPRQSGATVVANDMLGDVLDSVLRNAVQHNDADRPRITVSVRETNGPLEVRIADNGPGISDDLKTSVFEHDFTTRQTAHGFGLYFVSVMMELYGGDVWFEDGGNGGTVAVLQFRRADRT